MKWDEISVILWAVRHPDIKNARYICWYGMAYTKNSRM